MNKLREQYEKETGETCQKEVRNYCEDYQDEIYTNEYVEHLEKQAEAMGDRLKWAYCKEKGSDSIIGLDVCDNFREWRDFVPQPPEEIERKSDE